MNDAIPEVLMLVATCVVLAALLWSEGNVPGAQVFAGLSAAAALLQVWLLRADRRSTNGAAR